VGGCEGERFVVMLLKSTILLGPALAVELGANPIRKVVNLLQGLRNEVEAEGEHDKKAFDKAMCFCTKNDAKTAAEIDDATQRISSLEATIKELSGSNAQLKSEIKDLEEEIAEDTKSVDEATSVRKEEAAQYASESMELKTNIAALDAAIPALKKGLSGGSFLETLKPALVRAAQTAGINDRSQIMSLLQGKMQTGSADQILGILENMHDNFKENLIKSTKEEEEAISTYTNLMDGKNSELKAAKTEAEEKKGRVAGQVQKGADATEDLEDTQAALDTSTNFLANLRKSCKDKKVEFETNERLRMTEINAIQDTIKILNDDDALDLFKKTLPSPTAFVQIRKQVRRPVSFVQTAAMGKFDKLAKMVGDMVATLQEDQKQDDKHLKWCRSETATTEDQLSNVKSNVATHNQKLEQLANEAKTALEAIQILKKEVVDLNAAVAEATQQRQEEQTLYVQTQSELNLASTLLQKASERMKKAYEEAQEQKAAPAAAAMVQTESETAAMLGFSFIQVAQTEPYQKKTGKGLGIVAMIDQLRNDISAEQAEKKRDNEEQIKDYEEFMADSSASKDAKQTDITNKSAARGRLEELLQQIKKKKSESLEEQTAILSKVDALHQSCNFIMENHEARQQGRDNEIDGLKKSLAVLAGADGQDYGQPAPPQPPAFLQRRME